MAISVALVLLITSLIFRSGLLGVICTMPIVVTIAMSFGLMGWLEVPLDLATVLIASIAVGIGIDYSIHVTHRYVEELVLLNKFLVDWNAENGGRLKAALLFLFGGNGEWKYFDIEGDFSVKLADALVQVRGAAA